MSVANVPSVPRASRSGSGSGPSARTSGRPSTPATSRPAPTCARPLDAPLTLAPGARAVVPTGLTLEIPPGFEAQVRARSGLALKKGLALANGVGTIDADYRGEVGVIVVNLGAEPVTLARGERIAQLVVAPVVRALFERRARAERHRARRRRLRVDGDGVIEVAFLGSGSTGNCAVIRAGRTAVLLDAGLSPRQIGVRLGKLGMSLDDVSALLLTHEHSDHVSSAAALATKRGLPVYATRGTLAKAGLPGPLFADLQHRRGRRRRSASAGAT